MIKRTLHYLSPVPISLTAKAPRRYAQEEQAAAQQHNTGRDGHGPDIIDRQISVKVDVIFPGIIITATICLRVNLHFAKKLSKANQCPAAG